MRSEPRNFCAVRNTARKGVFGCDEAGQRPESAKPLFEGCARLGGTAANGQGGLFHGDGKRKDHTDHRAMAIGLDIELPVQFANPFAHAAEADADTLTCGPESRQLLRRNASTVVTHLESNLAGTERDLDGYRPTVSVAMDVRQALLQDAE